jgi:F-type H+-transporting ATPase subunit b
MTRLPWLSHLVLASTTGIASAADEAAEHAAAPTPCAGTIGKSIAAVIVFFVVYWVLKRQAWGPILKGLSDRENKIRQDLADAETARLNAEARLKEYDTRLASAEGEVRGLLNKAATDAEKIATSIRMQAQQETEEAKERAVKDIEQARNDALREVYEQAANLATNVAEKILRRNLNAADQRDLVNASLEQLQTAAKN